MLAALMSGNAAVRQGGVGCPSEWMDGRMDTETLGFFYMRKKETHRPDQQPEVGKGVDCLLQDAHLHRIPPPWTGWITQAEL